ncbi:MAG: hypothetical protein GKR95_19680 [Gammaproteobacteria bacterium]|nr:hypothetical protein [Gammaproteobacteria bacterium]
MFTFVYQSYGHYIRKFSQCQLYRHSGHCSNIGFSLHTKSIYFTDIDSCRVLAECGEIDTSLQVMRDAMSGGYNLFSIFTEPKNARRFSFDRIVRSGIFRKYLKSYYHELPETLVHGLAGLLEDHTKEVHERVLAHITEVPKEEASEQAGLGSEDDYQATYDSKWDRVTTDYEETYSWFLAVFWTLHRHSTMSEEFPLAISDDEIFENIAEFSNQKLVDTIRKKIGQYY